MAFPFFSIGYFIKRIKLGERITTAKISPLFFALFSALLLSLTYWLGHKNGRIAIGAGTYGNNMLVMYLVGLIGSISIFTLGSVTHANKYILTIWGTSVILGLSWCFQSIVIKLLEITLDENVFSLFMGLSITCVLLLIHYPIILFLNRKFPIFIGKISK